MNKQWISYTMAIGVFAVLFYIPFVSQNISSEDITGIIPEQLGLPTKPRNVQILTDMTLQDINFYMMNMIKEIGVQCIHCHVITDFSSDEKESKIFTRKKMIMMKEMNEKYFNKPEQDKVTCYTCHRGQLKPINKPEDEPEE